MQSPAADHAHRTSDHARLRYGPDPRPTLTPEVYAELLAGAEAAFLTIYGAVPDKCVAQTIAREWWQKITKARNGV